MQVVNGEGFLRWILKEVNILISGYGVEGYFSYELR